MNNLKIFKMIVIYTMLLNLIFLTGCWNYTEMDQQLNVAGIAIDKGQNGQKYHVSVEVITTGKSAEQPNSSQVIEADGDTIFNAVRGMITVTAKKLYFGHCKTLVIGEEMAKEGISDILDFFYRDAEARISMNVVLTKDCNARDILKSTGVDNDIIAYEIDDLIKALEKAGSNSFKIQIYEIFNKLQSQGKAVVMPAFHIDKVEDYETFRTTDYGVFKKDKLIGYLNQEERKLFTIVENQLNSGIIDLRVPGLDNEFVAFEIYKSQTKFNPEIVNGKLVMGLNVVTDVFIGEMDIQSNLGKKADRNAIKKVLEKQMKNSIETIIEKCQKEFNSDIFGFGLHLHNKYPKLWEKYKDNWDETFKDLDVNVNYKVNIRGTGVGSSTVKIS